MSDIVLKRRIRQANFSPSREGAWSEAKLLLNFSLPANLTAVFFVVATWISNLILVRQPNGYSQMGIFNAVNQWRVAILFLPTVMAQPFLAVLASLAGAGSGRQYRKAMRMSLAATTVAAFLPAVLITVLSGRIMGAYGAAFQNGTVTLILVAFATALGAPGIAIGNALTSLGRAWAAFAVVLAWSTVFVAGFFLMRASGAQGLGWAYLVSYFVHFVISLLLAARVMRKNFANAE
jgi:O-antigen/teichoic acid export membrane protein